MTHAAHRSVLIVAHTGRDQIRALAVDAANRLLAADFEVRMVGPDAASCGEAPVLCVDEDDKAAEGAELVLVFGGDGTFLRAAEFARPAGVPLLGVNLGHVGFLAEADPRQLTETVRAVVDGNYVVERRATVEAQVVSDGEVCAHAWALNEVSLERTNRERILEVAVAVDGRPLLRFGCDGVLCSTPTGSTAYAFSVGGPIVWPNVEALVVVPNAAHALFARPIVVSPESVVDIDLLSEDHEGVLSCDGRRSLRVRPGDRVRVAGGGVPIHIARLGSWTFGDRLVTRFQLPVRGFRDPEDRTP